VDLYRRPQYPWKKDVSNAQAEAKGPMEGRGTVNITKGSRGREKKKGHLNIAA